jgi:hypothetical protein
MDAPLLLVIAGGLFSLAGVLLGGLLTPLTQLFLERKRERRAAERAKLLVAEELLHAEGNLRSVCNLGYWPPVVDLNAFLPTSAWRENRSSIAGMVSEDLFRQLGMAYLLLEHDRARFALMDKLPAGTPLHAGVAKGIKESCINLAHLRRQLGMGGGWPDEVENKPKQEP